ncbi:3x TPR domain-containing [Cryptosporidium xiaoi]|uniref:3x TPR domain-containing n=1 Tax=Cryptosporidium xiaoi TaxID=659607 RepID=A0AAV9Y2K0_9CRYT
MTDKAMEDAIDCWEENLICPEYEEYLKTENVLPCDIFSRLLNSINISKCYSCECLFSEKSNKLVLRPLLKSFHIDKKSDSVEVIYKNIVDYYSEYINSEKRFVGKRLIQFEILSISILFLNIYMQRNWTGPPETFVDGISADWKPKVDDNLYTSNGSDGLITDVDLNNEEFNLIISKNDYINNCTSILEIDGECIYQKCNSVIYLTWSILLIEMLSLSKIDIDDELDGNNRSELIKLSLKYKLLNIKNNTLKYIYFWKQRIYKIWQRSLEGGIKFATVPYLENIIIDCYYKWLKDDLKITINNFPINERYKDNLLRSFQFDIDEYELKIIYSNNINIISILLLDLAISLATFSRANPCAIILKLLSKLNGFKYSFTGALGLKRVSQRESTAQLVVEINRFNKELEYNTNDNVDIKCENGKEIPENILLKDIDPDIDLFENIELDDKNNTNLTSCLKIIEQCILLVHSVAIYESSPTNDLIAYEQLNALTNRILIFDISKINDEDIRRRIHNWLCYSTALWYRCYSEHHRGKTADRACLQLQSLVDQFNDKEPGPYERLKLVFSVNYPNVWEAKKELGIRMMRIGSVLSAYNMFVEMCMWEDAVDCLIVAGRQTEAIELVEKQLRIRETPRLYCSLGDLTQNIEYYEKSWNLSRHRFARAQRSLGNYYFKKNEYENALEAYIKASLVNSTNVNCWFSLGCVALRLEKWDVAQQAFSRVVSLDQQQGEAWANLAAALSKKLLWNEAQNAIDQGLKYSRDNWMMWDSCLKIAIQREDLNRIIESLSSILKLPSSKERFPMWSLPKIIELIKSDKYYNDITSYNEKRYSLINKSLNLLKDISQTSSKPVVYYVLCEIQLLKKDYVSAYSSKIRELRGSADIIFNDKISTDDRYKYLKDIPNIVSDAKEIISKLKNSQDEYDTKLDEVNMILNTIIKRLRIIKPEWCSLLENI